MAAGLKLQKSPARVVCMMGDGEQTEGQVWEAAISAAHWKLDNLVGLVDINGAGSDGDPQETMATEPLKDKWTSFGWDVFFVTRRARSRSDIHRSQPGAQ